MEGRPIERQGARTGNSSGNEFELPNVLAQMNDIDLSTEIFGQKMKLPFFLKVILDRIFNRV